MRPSFTFASDVSGGTVVLVVRGWGEGAGGALLLFRAWVFVSGRARAVVVVAFVLVAWVPGGFAGQGKGGAAVSAVRVLRRRLRHPPSNQAGQVHRPAQKCQTQT